MEEFYIEKCRICNSKVEKFLDLGTCHAPEEFRTKEELKKPIISFPLGLAYCPSCGQVQLSHEIPADVMYKQNYFYDYSNTKTGEKHWTEEAAMICKTYGLTNKDTVVDIGSNTGKLLQIFKSMGVNVQGVDPATKLVKIALERGVPTIDSYFTPAAAKEIVKKHGQVKVITCNNVFDHVPDLYDFMKGITILLQEKGVFVVEVPYFATFCKTLGHVVYHQQIDYVLVKPFSKLFEACNMELIDCEKIPYHGGSIRLFIAFKGQHKVSEHVAQFIKEEDAQFKDRKKALDTFAKGVLSQSKDLVTMLKKLKSENKSIAAMGASAKGNTLLFYSHIGPELIDFITEKSELKIGRYTPLGIPVVTDSEIMAKKPDYLVLLAWNFSDELFKNMKPYTDTGGKFIVPIPKLRIVE